ncbi:MAG: esterase family protein [Acidobacteriia bacterium]|nr:esterase family protein [Terriglobia bacterium]
MMRWLHWIVLLPFLLPHSPSYGRQMFSDHSHFSRVFGEPRIYRILLPPDYETSGKAYPVIYYFHGHSDRYTLERYDEGTDTLPKMIDFVSKHDVIVVSVDGFVGRDYTGFYGGSPWDIRRDGGDFDFGSYFQELVAHIDSTQRTLTDRRHRATSGLSMGGFLSLYLSARYPHLIGSASAFNPAPEFFTGEKGRRSLWRSKDHVANHSHSMVRLVRASGDYISQYHEETRDAYARADEVDFEYRQDEYHKHWATSIGETFEFHMRAFANPQLNNTPEAWSYANAYKSFEVWGYQVSASSNEPGYTYLEDVTQGGLRVTTRRWAPDGPSIPACGITIVTAPIYSAGRSYAVLDYSLKDGTVSKQEVKADAEGRITWTVDGEGHQLSFLGPGTGAHPPVLLPLSTQDQLRCPSQREISLPIRIYNPRREPMTHVKLVLSSEYPTVQILKDSHEIANLESGAVADVSADLRVRFTAGSGYFAPTRLRVNMTYDGWYEVAKNLDLLVIPEDIPAPVAVEVLDGRTMTFPVFHQKGNQGGGAAVERRVTEGKGNGNGILEPGEEATIWVKMAQGMDPFDKNNWYRCKVYSDSPWIAEIADIQEEKQREWTGAQERTSLTRLSPQTPAGVRIPLLLDNESWSFHYTPDVRYGREKLYQAFQLHTHHLHRYELRVP